MGFKRERFCGRGYADAPHCILQTVGDSSAALGMTKSVLRKTKEILGMTKVGF